MAPVESRDRHVSGDGQTKALRSIQDSASVDVVPRDDRGRALGPSGRDKFFERVFQSDRADVHFDPIAHCAFDKGLLTALARPREVAAGGEYDPFVATIGDVLRSEE